MVDLKPYLQLLCPVVFFATHFGLKKLCRRSVRLHCHLSLETEIEVLSVLLEMEVDSEGGESLRVRHVLGGMGMSL